MEHIGKLEIGLSKWEDATKETSSQIQDMLLAMKRQQTSDEKTIEELEIAKANYVHQNQKYELRNREIEKLLEESKLKIIKSPRSGGGPDKKFGFKGLVQDEKKEGP